MHWLGNNLIHNLIHLGAAHPQATGWSTSAVIHALGVAAVTVWLGTTFLEGPRLPGQQNSTRAQLMARWTPREPLPAPPIVVEIAKPQIVVLPNQTHFVKPVYEESSTDVSKPTPEVLARQLLPTAVDRVLPRKPRSARCCKCEPVPTRQVERQMALASLPVPASVAGAVDQLPRKLLTNPAPPYPPDAYERRQQGLVLLKVQINEHGLVEAISVSESSGVASLDRAALQTVRTWRFEPARHGGVPVSSLVIVPIRFMFRDR